MPGPSQATANHRGRAALVGALAVVLAGLPAPAHAKAPAPSAPPQLAAPADQRVVVDLRFDPPRALRDARLRIRSPGGGEVALLAIETPSLVVRLPPGTFELEVTARRHTARMSLTVTPGMGQVDVHLRRHGAAGTRPTFSGHKGLPEALVLAALLHLGVGATVTLAGSVRKNNAIHSNEALLLDGLVDAASAEPAVPTGLALVEASYPTAAYHRGLGRAMNLELAGTAVVAGSLAALVTILPIQARARRRIAWIGVGVGAAMTAGGAVWLATHLDQREARLSQSDPARRVTSSDLRPLGAAQTGAALLTGLGIGLVVYPCLALLTDSLRRARDRRGRARVTPYMGPGQAGLAFHGRF